MADDHQIIRNAVKRMEQDIDSIQMLSDGELCQICDALERSGIKNFPYRVYTSERKYRRAMQPA